MKTGIVNNYTICEKNMVSEGEEEPTKMPKKYRIMRQNIGFQNSKWSIIAFLWPVKANKRQQFYAVLSTSSLMRIYSSIDVVIAKRKVLRYPLEVHKTY